MYAEGILVHVDLAPEDESRDIVPENSGVTDVLLHRMPRGVVLHMLEDNGQLSTVNFKQKLFTIIQNYSLVSLVTLRSSPSPVV